jgi:hypothetical protein
MVAKTAEQDGQPVLTVEKPMDACHTKNGISSGRNGDGRFTFGNPGGPGRPRRVTELDYLAALAEAVPLETWRAICRRAGADALAGDHKAREWIARYLLGNPAELPSLWCATGDQEKET